MEVISVQNFNKSFGEKTIHHQVNFTVQLGECVGLLGGSGSGKSVLLRSLIGLEKPDSGSIKIDNEEITTLNERELFEVRKKVAYVFQSGALFDSMTVFENIAYPIIEHTALTRSEVESTVRRTLGMFNLSGIEDLTPSELSGGMQKRVGLARAIAIQPKVVLYDEPTAGLDPANTESIQELMLLLKNKGSTAILVTHDMDTALRVCDRIYFLKDHQLMDLGPIQELRNNRERFMKLFLKEPI
jgi:phospholipid/cholesterol/gamma-HCH transport system ATP-binding protein